MFRVSFWFVPFAIMSKNEHTISTVLCLSASLVDTSFIAFTWDWRHIIRPNQVVWKRLIKLVNIFSWKAAAKQTEQRQKFEVDTLLIKLNNFLIVKGRNILLKFMCPIYWWIFLFFSFLSTKHSLLVIFICITLKKSKLIPIYLSIYLSIYQSIYHFYIIAKILKKVRILLFRNKSTNDYSYFSYLKWKISAQ